MFLQLRSSVSVRICSDYRENWIIAFAGNMVMSEKLFWIPNEHETSTELCRLPAGVGWCVEKRWLHLGRILLCLSLTLL